MKKIILPLVLSVTALIFGFSQEIHAEETDTNQLTSVEQIKKISNFAHADFPDVVKVGEKGKFVRHKEWISLKDSFKVVENTNPTAFALDSDGNWEALSVGEGELIYDWNATEDVLQQLNQLPHVVNDLSSLVDKYGQSVKVAGPLKVHFKVISNMSNVYRLYNSYSGEHFYTNNLAERQHLVRLGWQDENISWVSPTDGDKVYRLYNPNTGDHHFTLQHDECNQLSLIGWQVEGVAFYAKGTKPIYRLYNPNAEVGSHFFTQSEEEKVHLEKLGWQSEGIAWYAE